MTNPTTPGRYKVTFKARDSAPEGTAWHYTGLLTYKGGKWLLNGKPCDMSGAVSWEEKEEA